LTRKIPDVSRTERSQHIQRQIQGPVFGRA
jgi:hypothetical protein